MHRQVVWCSYEQHTAGVVLLAFVVSRLSVPDELLLLMAWPHRAVAVDHRYRYPSHSHWVLPLLAAAVRQPHKIRWISSRLKKSPYITNYKLL